MLIACYNIVLTSLRYENPRLILPTKCDEQIKLIYMSKLVSKVPAK